jgi:hypothetical protein
VRPTTDGTFTTQNFGLASFIWYVLGPDAHLWTTADGGSPAFTFIDDPPRCRELGDAFFAEESCVVGNARELLETMRKLRVTVGKAKESPHLVWIAGEKG